MGLANLAVPEERVDVFGVARHFDPTVTPEAIAWLRVQSRLPVVVKGVLRGDDAVACLNAGAAAVVVSNHGGRQLDGAVATADALPEVVEAVAGRAEVYVDGGIRRGVDVVKSLALGAQAVLDGYREELERSLALCGTPTLRDVTPDLLAPPARVP